MEPKSSMDRFIRKKYMGLVKVLLAGYGCDDEKFPQHGCQDLPAPAGQEVEGPCPSTGSSAWDSGSTWASGSSQADGGHCFVPGTPLDSEQEEGVDVAKDEVALKVIREQLQCRDKDEGQQLLFLQAIYPACLAAREGGEDTLEPHCCKAAVVKRIVELIEELPDDSSHSAILTHSLAAVGNFCTMKPALEPALETHLLRAALHSVFTLGTEKDTTDIQALRKLIPEVLDAMLGNLLAESPDTDRLHFILEVFGKFFSVGQRRSFLQTAVLAIHDPLLRVSQAGLVLVYSLLGEAQQLMGETLLGFPQEGVDEHQPSLADTQQGVVDGQHCCL
ncbi:unnamed protein product [Caretta caretta]